jgi:hypothetical protein
LTGALFSAPEVIVHPALILIRRLFTKRKVNEDDLCSIVLLLRESHFFTREELMEGGRLGFGKNFDGVEDPMYFVVQQSFVTMIKAGPHAMHVVHQRQPYLGDKEAVSKSLMFREQREAWLAHTGWASIDMLNPGISNAEAYPTLARFALQLADQNCSAVFLPKHNVLLTNDGQAEEWLRSLIRGEKRTVSQVR